MDGETMAECLYEIMTQGRYADEATELMLGEVRSANTLAGAVRTELVTVLEQIALSRQFGRNSLTNRLWDILTEQAELGHAVTEIIAEVLSGKR